MKYLGLDFGAKRIGLAVSDDLGQIAFPKTVIKNDSKALENILALAAFEGVEKVIFGESKDASGFSNKIQKEIEYFSELIVSAGFQVDFEKEFWSSFEAHQRQGKESLHARKQKVSPTENLDAKAAAVILQRYLDRKKV